MDLSRIDPETKTVLRVLVREIAGLNYNRRYETYETSKELDDLARALGMDGFSLHAKINVDLNKVIEMDPWQKCSACQSEYKITWRWENPECYDPVMCPFCGVRVELPNEDE